MALNVPTVIWLDPTLFEFRESAIVAREQLVEVGIYHHTLESATAHIASIWANVDEWWEASSVQAAKNRFLDRYARRPTDLLTEIEMVIRDSIR